MRLTLNGLSKTRSISYMGQLQQTTWAIGDCGVRIPDVEVIGPWPSAGGRVRSEQTLVGVPSMSPVIGASDR